MKSLSSKVKTLKENSYTLYLVYTDQRLTWWKKYFLAVVIGYLFSPIDLIPDFIPIVGYLDDLIIVPVGIYIALKLIPTDILEEAKKKSELEENKSIPIGYKTSIVIIGIWIIGIIIIVYWLLKVFNINIIK